MTRTTEERFWVKVRKTADCWLWIANRDRKGYGLFRIGKKMVRAHRWSYEALIQPIPAGLQLDHLCRTSCCVRPDHLEPVTLQENVLRGGNTQKTHCPYGHAYSNKSYGLHQRICLVCRLEATRRWRASTKDEA